MEFQEQLLAVQKLIRASWVDFHVLQMKTVAQANALQAFASSEVYAEDKLQEPL